MSQTYEGFSLSGKRVLLVGATGVLGRGYATALQDAQADLVIADRGGSDVLELAREIGAKAVEMDVANEASVVEGVAAAVSHLGGLDGCLMNAAITGEALVKAGDAFAPFEDYALDLWQKTIDVNLTGTFLVCREAGRAMKASGGGSLITVSSIYGCGWPGSQDL